MNKRIYKGAKTIPFGVRIHEKHEGSIKALAERLSISEVEVKREIVEAGLKALQTA